MTGKQYQEEALKTLAPISAEDENHEKENKTLVLMEGVMGICGEAGECIELVKKFMFQGHELYREDMAEELGDVAWYLAVSAWAIGYDLDDIFELNLKKLKDRYPDGFDFERSVNRDKED